MIEAHTLTYSTDPIWGDCWTLAVTLKGPNGSLVLCRPRPIDAGSLGSRSAAFDVAYRLQERQTMQQAEEVERWLRHQGLGVALNAPTLLPFEDMEAAMHFVMLRLMLKRQIQ